MRLIVTFALLLAVVRAMAADGVKVEAHRDGEVVRVEATALVRADVQTAWNVLTAYERYAEFIPDLKSSKVLARSANTAIVEQKGETGFFLFHFPLEVVMTVTESAPDSVSSRAIAGTFKEMNGTYTLAPEGDGMRLRYSGQLIPAFRLPPLIGVPALRSAVEKQFAALVARIEREANPSAEPRER